MGKPRKKIKKVYSRRSRTGIDAAPTDSFFHFSAYIRTEVDKKEVALKIKSYLKDNLSPEDYTLALKAPEWHFSLAFFASAVSWREKGLELPENENWNKTLLKNTNIILAAGKKANEAKADITESVITKKPIAHIIKEKTSDFIAEVEGVIDNWMSGSLKSIEEYSLYERLRIIDAPYNLAKGVLDYYTPIMDEADELVNKKTPELVEGYSHMSVPRRKEYLKLLSGFVHDAGQYMEKKKTQRKIRKPMVRTADKQVAGVKFLKESTEFKLVSIQPGLIVGARRVYMFNVKQRMVIELVSRLPGGFEVKGTTIQGIDDEQSRQVRLRKPEEFLPSVQKKNPNAIGKDWAALSTKTAITTGRINKDTIIIRVLDR